MQKVTNEQRQNETTNRFLKLPNFNTFLIILIVGSITSLVYILWVWWNPAQYTDLLSLIPVQNSFIRLSSNESNNRTQRDQVLLITVASGNYWYKPLAKANRDNYCARHGYTCMFVEQVKREPSVAVHWSKMAEVMKHLNDDSPYEWILLTDVDSYIMNQSLTIPYLVDYAFSEPGLLLNKKYFNQSVTEHLNGPTAESVDIMVALDNHDINIGIMLFRNTNFTRYFMNEMWIRRKDNGQTIPKAKDWPEQGVFIHLCHIWPELSYQHIALIHQKVFNSYGWLDPKKEGVHYQFKWGEFLIHFPGPHKLVMASFTKELIKAQPELKPVAVKHQIPF